METLSQLRIKKFKNVTGNADLICLILIIIKFNAELIESPDGRARGLISLIKKSAGISPQHSPP